MAVVPAAPRRRYGATAGRHRPPLPAGGRGCGVHAARGVHPGPAGSSRSSSSSAVRGDAGYPRGSRVRPRGAAAATSRRRAAACADSAAHRRPGPAGRDLQHSC